MKHKNIRILSLLLSILVIISSVTLLTSCSNNNSKKSSVDKKINNILQNDDFEELEEQQQIQNLKTVLESLEEDGDIAEGTIYYDDCNKIFSFQYSDGTLGGVSLQEFGDKYNGGSSSRVYKNISTSSEQNNVDTNYENTAIVLNAFENSPYRRDYYDELEKEWDSNGLQTDVDTDVTVDDLKKLSKYDVIVFAMHGSVYNGSPVLCINQIVTKETNEAYKKEINNKLIAKVAYKDGKWHYWIFPEFFTYQYGIDELESKIIFSETCMFYGDDSVDTKPDCSFANAFVEISEGAIVGYHNSVLADYSRNVMKSTIDNTLDGKTVNESLEIAKKTYGENDNYQYEADGKYIAYPIISGDINERLIELKVSDFSILDKMVITLGEINVIEPEIIPADATSYSIKWSSSDESVATVSPNGEDGIITALAKGTTIITAELTSGGKTITKTTDLRVASKARDTVLVLDISGSMRGEPLREMKKSAIQFCNDLLKDEYNNRVGIVFYDDGISTIDLTDDLDMLVSRIESISDGGRTDMEAGLSAADKMLRNSGKADSVKNVVVMADGLPNEGKISYSGSMPTGNYSGYYTSVSYANAVIDTAKQMMSNYNLYSLGFFHGLYSDEKDFATTLMKELTNQADGYHQVDKAEDLQFAFGDISEDINVGSKIVINIACPVDVRVSYGGEMLSSSNGDFCSATSFGTLQLLGKNKDIKVVSLDSDKEYEVELIGAGVGKMDYSVNYFDEKEQLSDYRSFEAVPITMTTVIKSSTDNSAEDIALNIDEDGDGEIDVVWTALAKSKGEITYEKNPPEPEEPEKEEPPVEEKEDMPVWAIVLICVFAFVFVGGGIVAVVISAKKSKSDSAADSELEIPEHIPMNIVMCSRCGKTHPNNQPCECLNEQNKDRITEDTERSTGFIQVTNGSMSGFSVPIKDGETLYLGKDPKVSNLVFTSDYKNVSRMHCAVTFDAKANRYFVTDSSSNGTYLISKKRLIKGKRTPVNINTVLILANDECTVILG